MRKRLSEQELFARFQQDLSSERVPEAFAERLRQQVLAEVALSIRQEEVTPVTPPVRRVKSAPQPKGWLDRLFQGQISFGFGQMPALAGMAVAAIFLAVLLVQYLAAPPASVMAMVHVTDGTAIIFRRATGESELVVTGGTALLAEGDQVITDNGRARIDYLSGQSTIVQPGSRVELEELNINNEHSEVVIRVHSGETLHEVTTGFDEGDRFEVNTATAKSSASHTAASNSNSFVVSVDADQDTHLKSIAGVVNVETDAGSTAIGANQQVVVERGKPPTLQPAPTADLDPTPTFLLTPTLLPNVLLPTPTVIIVTPTRQPTLTSEPTATDAPTATATRIVIIAPTSTSTQAVNTPTATSTLAISPPTATATATATNTSPPVVTAAPTNTPVPPTATATETAPPVIVPPTNTPVPPTATPVPPTNTPVPPTATPTREPPTAVPTATPTQAPPTPTWTPGGGTIPQPTATPEATSTSTPLRGGGTLPDPIP